MAYRPPGAYAQFVKTSSPVVNVGASRVLALVGTGVNYYTVSNETVKKSSDRPYDTLTHSNVFEVSSVSSRPVYPTKNNPDNVFYEQGVDYTLRDGKYIVWRTLSKTTEEESEQIRLVNVDTDPFINEGSRAFRNNCSWAVDFNNSHFVIDGDWRIEVTFANNELGCYRIIKVDTNELIGEYVVSSTPNTAIPGINLTVLSTYKLPEDADVNSDENEINAGDYFVIRTTADKTEQEATASIEQSSSVIGLRNSIKKINIINPAKVVDGKYRIIMRNATSKEFQVCRIHDGTDELIYPDATDSSIYATWIENDEIYDIIPGVEVILNSLKYLPTNNDSVTIVTSARVVDESLPGEGDSYYVTYKYRKADSEYNPKYFSDFTLLAEEYGAYEVTASGFVKNSLTLGAEIAFSNGLGQVVTVQAKGNTDAEFCAAIDKLKQALPYVENVSIVVPLTTSTVVGAYCQNHVNYMSSNEVGKERICFLGAYPGQAISKAPTGSDRTMGILETTKGYYDERVTYIVPGYAIKSCRDVNTGKYYDRPVPGCYLAVAVAGVALSHDPAEPLTRKTIGGFSYLPEVYTESEMNLMAQYGATIIVMSGNSLMIRHGVTTSYDELNSYEQNPVMIKDYVIEAVRSTLGRAYIGRKNVSGLVSDINYTVNNILSQIVNQVIIESYQGVSVRRSSEDPRTVNVSFEIMPIYGLTYIMITFSFSAI